MNMKMPKFNVPNWLWTALEWLMIVGIVIGGIAVVIGIIVGFLALVIMLRFGIPALCIWFALDYGVGDWLASMIPQVPAAAFHPTFWQALIGVMSWRITWKVLFGYKRPDPAVQKLVDMLKRAEKATKVRIEARAKA